MPKFIVFTMLRTSIRISVFKNSNPASLKFTLLYVLYKDAGFGTFTLMYVLYRDAGLKRFTFYSIFHTEMHGWRC